MKGKKYLIWILAAGLLAGCGTKKKAVEQSASTEQAEEVIEEPSWHTCLIQGARVVVYTEGSKVSANMTMQTVRDSMTVISVMPMLGIEMMRIEATPMELTAIDKIHGQYAEATFAELNRKLTPSMNWDILQQICTAGLPTGEEKARLLYSFGEETIELVIDYPPRKQDVPVHIGNINKNKYTKVDVSRFL